MSDLLASAVKSHLGLQLLHWAVSQSDIWHLAHRCSELVQKINEPLEKSAYVLDNLLAMDEDDIHLHCSGMRDLHLNRMHFDDEDDYNGEQMQRFNNSSGGSSSNNRVPNARAGSFLCFLFCFFFLSIFLFDGDCDYVLFSGGQWWSVVVMAFAKIQILFGQCVCKR